LPDFSLSGTPKTLPHAPLIEIKVWWTSVHHFVDYVGQFSYVHSCSGHLNIRFWLVISIEI